MILTRWAGVIAMACSWGATTATAQAAPPREQGPAVGQPAPDFALVPATRKGVGKTPVRLSDFKGKTVVLAFFYQARTKG
jgi:cytochrome oxidase Cu insertion factor (SCO1/SenC/PrrC family)